MLGNQSPIPCNIKFKQSKKEKQKNKKKLNRSELKLNPGHLIKKSKNWQIENSETSESSKISEILV